MFVQTRLGKIRNEYDSLDENSKIQNVDRVMVELSKQIEGFSKYGTQYQTIVTGLQANEINDIFFNISAANFKFSDDGEVQFLKSSICVLLSKFLNKFIK